MAPYSRITTLVADRAYLDGADLYELEQMRIRFVVIAKKDMVAYGTALCRTTESDIRYERIETVLHGQGRDQETESLLTQVQVAFDIRTWDSYRPPPVKGKRLLIADRPALNAVVVRIWQNKQLEHPRIYLTNQPIDNPWLIVDLYDDRSWIENGLFRNTKQFWTMTRWFPKKNAAGVLTHLTFVMLMTATATAFRLWSKAQAIDTIEHAPAPTRHFSFQMIQPPEPSGPVPVEPDSAPQASSTHLAASLSEEHSPLAFSHHLLNGIGPSRWRMDLQFLNRDKLIVFFGNIYGIFDIPVFLTLTGVPFHLPPAFGSREDILTQYRLLLE